MFRRMPSPAPVLLFATALLLALPSPAQEMSAEEQAAMEAMMAAGQPGEHHEHMAPLEGTWTVQATFWMPGSPEPMTAEGVSTFKWILGGRYLQQTYTSEFMGMPFEGIGTMAYDNMNEQYMATWTDSMSTAIMSETGQCSDGGKKVTWHGEMPDPMSGKNIKTRMVQVMEGPDRLTMTSYGTLPDGSETKIMELVYSRKS